MENIFLFILMSIFLIILPGPDTAIVTKNTLIARNKGGLKTAFGICCALLIHTSAAVLGLSAMIVKSAVLFSIFKYVGAIYLIYLGIKTLWSLRKKEVALTMEQTRKSQFEPQSYFKQGFFTNILNPKVALFFLTFFPQFVNHGNETFLSFLIMGLTYTMLTALWFSLYVFLINQMSTLMKKRITQNIIEGITGTILVGFGIKLALEKS